MTISILYLFICMDLVTYIKTLFNYLNFYNFLTLLKMVKNTIKRCESFFLYKINKNIQRKLGVECFVYWWVQNTVFCISCLIWVIISASDKLSMVTKKFYLSKKYSITKRVKAVEKKIFFPLVKTVFLPLSWCFNAWRNKKKLRTNIHSLIKILFKLKPNKQHICRNGVT